MFCYVTGADVAAADARQIPDHVRSNHREKYPSSKSWETHINRSVQGSDLTCTGFMVEETGRTSLVFGSDIPLSYKSIYISELFLPSVVHLPPTLKYWHPHS